MKKIYIIVFVLGCILSNAQIRHYQDAFDSLFTLEHSVNSNQLVIYGSGTERMEGLLLMYEATLDVKYLQIFVQYGKNVIDKRDDLRDTSPFPSIYGPHSEIINYQGVASPTWSSNYYNIQQNVGAPYPNQHNNFLIIHPLIKFYNIIIQNPALQNVIVNNNDPAIQYHSQYTDSPVSLNFVANEFLVKIIETINYYDAQGLWDSGVGAYREFNFRSTLPPFNGGARYPEAVLPMNMQANFGRVLLELYIATNNNDYLEKVRAIGNYIKLNTVTEMPEARKSWHYWGAIDPNNATPPFLREDTSHSALTVSFPLECYKNSITNDNGTSLLFDLVDMTEYANTLTKDIYEDVMIMKEGVSNSQVGAINIWNYKNNTSVSGNTILKPNAYIYSDWIAYSEINPNIYQILSDFMTSKHFVPTTGPYDEGNSYYITDLKALGYLAKYNRKFVPIAAEHSFDSASEWVGVSAGNFDNDITDGEEFVFLRNLDYKISIQNKEENKARFETTIPSLLPNEGLGLFQDNVDYNYDWADIASGDFYGDSKNEIIALSNCNVTGRNGFYTFNVDGGNINFDQNNSGLGFGTSSMWVGVTAGDFVPNGKDDIITVRNIDKRLYIYKSNGTSIQNETNILLYDLPVNEHIGKESSIVAIDSGNLDGNTSNGDELAILVNGDTSSFTGVYIYSIDSANSSLPLSLIAKSVGWGQGSEFRGLAVGDFNNNGKDEVLIHRNHDAHYRIYELNNLNTGLINAGSELFDTRQTDDNVLCAGNFDALSKNDELIALRNTDGGIIMYSNFMYASSTNRTSLNSFQEEIADVNEVANNDFLIYPNPNNSGKLYFDLKNKVKYFNEKIVIEFTDITGNSLIKREIEKNKNSIDISQYKTGLYFIKVSIGNKHITKKVIKL